MNITKASLILEIDGSSYVANLKGVNLNAMVNLIGSLTPEGILQVQKSSEIKFVNMEFKIKEKE